VLRDPFYQTVTALTTTGDTALVCSPMLTDVQRFSELNLLLLHFTATPREYLRFTCRQCALE